MSGSWEAIFESAEDDTRLHCTETVNAKHWWMHPFVPGYLSRQQRMYLDDLQRELQKQGLLVCVACGNGPLYLQWGRKELNPDAQ